MEKFDLSKKEFFTIKNDEGQDLNAWMIKPTNFKKNKKHPLLMFVYGGPGINTVNDSWEWMNYFWWQMLAQKGYIVVSVDARGTGFRGKEFQTLYIFTAWKARNRRPDFSCQKFR